MDRSPGNDGAIDRAYRRESSYRSYRRSIPSHLPAGHVMPGSDSRIEIAFSLRAAQEYDLAQISQGGAPMRRTRVGLAAGVLFHVALWAHDVPASSAAEESQTFPRLTLKFKEGSAVRLRSGVFVSSLGMNISPVNDLLRGESVVRIERLVARPEDDLEKERVEAEKHSRRTVPDLNLYYRVVLRPGTDTGTWIGLLGHAPEVFRQGTMVPNAALGLSPQLRNGPRRGVTEGRMSMSKPPSGVGLRDPRRESRRPGYPSRVSKEKVGEYGEHVGIDRELALQR